MSQIFQRIKMGRKRLEYSKKRQTVSIAMCPAFILKLVQLSIYQKINSSKLVEILIEELWNKRPEDFDQVIIKEKEIPTRWF